MEAVSVVIPAYNAESFLKEALASVVGQTCDEKIQIIVVDDGSTDATAEVARQFASVEYIRQDNQGAAHARNRGMLECRGELIAFLDADDLFTLDKTALQLAVLQTNSRVDAVFGHLAEFVDSSADEGQHRAPVDYAPAYLQGTMLVRRTFAQKVGPFDTTLEVGEFLDWYSRAKALGINDVMLPDVVMKRRLHSGNLGLSDSKAKVGYASALRKHLKRMRETATMSERQSATINDDDQPASINGERQ